MQQVPTDPETICFHFFHIFLAIFSHISDEHLQWFVQRFHQCLTTKLNTLLRNTQSISIMFWKEAIYFVLTLLLSSFLMEQYKYILTHYTTLQWSQRKHLLDRRPTCPRADMKRWRCRWRRWRWKTDVGLWTLSRTVVVAAHVEPRTGRQNCRNIVLKTTTNKTSPQPPSSMI